ncbi:MAG: NRDE family protein [Alphaproteobacteria bacterium]|nr:NRDE family protein [Alphaproteobacteria bacterium]
MCTLVLLRRPSEAWPLIVAANRDEMAGRLWRAPARHWPDRPEVVAGLDELAGGSWLGLNDHGVVAAVLNRTGSLGPAEGKRSRGELVLDALDHADAVDAAAAFMDLDASAWRSFNLVIADSRDAFWVRGLGAGRTQVTPVPEGVSMLASTDLSDTVHPRIARYLPRFRDLPAPDPGSGRWEAWIATLSAREHDPTEPDSRNAMTVATDWGYGTVSSSLIAVPAPESDDRRPVWLFAAGRPDATEYTQLKL